MNKLMGQVFNFLKPKNRKVPRNLSWFFFFAIATFFQLTIASFSANVLLVCHLSSSPALLKALKHPMPLECINMFKDGGHTTESLEILHGLTFSENASLLLDL
jgi:hypothetical protein